MPGSFPHRTACALLLHSALSLLSDKEFVPRLPRSKTPYETPALWTHAMSSDGHPPGSVLFAVLSFSVLPYILPHGQTTLPSSETALPPLQSQRVLLLNPQLSCFS